MKATKERENRFDEMVHLHQGLIWKVCKTFCQNVEDQEDLFQDIVIKLWNGFSTYQVESKLSTWIYRVSLNQAIDKSRKKKPRTIPLDYHVISRESKKSTNTSSQYDYEALHLAIGRLKPIEKALILLFLEQQSYKEIAEVMGMSEKNVGVRLVRIKQKLKKFYSEITQLNSGL